MKGALSWVPMMPRETKVSRTAARLIAVAFQVCHFETYLGATFDSRYHGGPIQSPLKSPVSSQQSIVLGGLRGALNWASILPRDTSLSDNVCEFIQPRLT